MYLNSIWIYNTTIHITNKRLSERTPGCITKIPKKKKKIPNWFMACDCKHLFVIYSYTLSIINFLAQIINVDLIKIFISQKCM